MKGKRLLLSLFKFLLISYAVSAILILIMSFMLYKFHLSSGFVSGGITFCYIISSFLAGFLFGKQRGEKKYLWGLAIGLCYFVVLFVLGIIFRQSLLVDGSTTIAVFFMCSIGGMLGGMVS